MIIFLEGYKFHICLERIISPFKSHHTPELSSSSKSRNIFSSEDFRRHIYNLFEVLLEIIFTEWNHLK